MAGSQESWLQGYFEVLEIQVEIPGLALYPTARRLNSIENLLQEELAIYGPNVSFSIWEKRKQELVKSLQELIHHDFQHHSFLISTEY